MKEFKPAFDMVGTIGEKKFRYSSLRAIMDEIAEQYPKIKVNSFIMNSVLYTNLLNAESYGIQLQHSMAIPPSIDSNATSAYITTMRRQMLLVAFGAIEMTQDIDESELPPQGGSVSPAAFSKLLEIRDPDRLLAATKQFTLTTIQTNQIKQKIHELTTDQPSRERTSVRDRARRR